MDGARASGVSCHGNPIHGGQRSRLRPDTIDNGNAREGHRARPRVQERVRVESFVRQVSRHLERQLLQVLVCFDVREGTRLCRDRRRGPANLRYAGGCSQLQFGVYIEHLIGAKDQSCPLVSGKSRCADADAVRSEIQVRHIKRPAGACSDFPRVSCAFVCHGHAGVRHNSAARVGDSAGDGTECRLASALRNE